MDRQTDEGHFYNPPSASWWDFKLRRNNTFARFSAISDKGDNFSYCFPVHQSPSKKGSILKGKNFLPRGFLIELELNDTSTLVGHFVSSPRERKKRDRRDSRGDERGKGKK